MWMTRGGAPVRPAAVAGLFYPDDPRELREMVRGFLATAPAPRPDPMALVAPHAGYVYSGFTAACGYRALPAAPADRPRRVFLVGPSHRVYLEGASVGDHQAFASPLGEVPVDREICAALAREPDVTTDPLPHLQEHSLEVHLPFLQETVGHFRLVPLVYGRMASARLAQLLEAHRQPGDLIVASSDLSHFHPYDEARRLDSWCHKAVLEEDGEAMTHCEACGGIGIGALMGMAREHHWLARLADYRNSGDTAGDKHRVVGYASYLYYPRPAA